MPNREEYEERKKHLQEQALEASIRAQHYQVVLKEVGLEADQLQYKYHQMPNTTASEKFKRKLWQAWHVALLEARLYVCHVPGRKGQGGQGMKDFEKHYRGMEAVRRRMIGGRPVTFGDLNRAYLEGQENMNDVDDLDFDELMRDPPPGDFVMRFGQHRGKTLDQIAHTDEGLKYLDWLAGLPDAPWKRGAIQRAREYLADPAIAAELKELLDG
jgi:hypothetical protein